jgi:ribosomal protein L37AE/L43A
MIGLAFLIIILLIVVFWLVYLGTRPAVPISKTTESAMKVKSKYTVVNGVKCKEDDKYYIIKTNETEICPFCKSNRIYSGSWSPECCENCGAMHMLGIWLKDKKKIKGGIN